MMEFRREFTGVVVLAVLFSGCAGVYNEEIVTSTTSTVSTTSSSTTSTTTSSTSTTTIAYPIEVEFETLLEHYNCRGVSDKRLAMDVQYIINNRTSLESIWDVGYHGELPEIDFSNSTIIAVFWMNVPEGRRIEITKIMEYENEIILLYNKTISPGGHRRRRAKPCHIVNIKKIEKSVIFESGDMTTEG